MSLSTWISDATANRYRKTYFNGFVDIKDGDIIIRNGSIKTPMNTISFNDTTGFVNFGNVYFGSAVYVYNPTTTSNIDFVSYVNTNDSNISLINSSITSINSTISTTNSSITTINSKIGTLNYDPLYDFTTVNNLFINPGGTIQYEDALGNHPDLIPSVISNTNNISTLSTRTTDISYLAGTPNTTTIANKLSTSVLSFGSTLNGVSTTTFGYISTLSGNAQTALDSKCSLTGVQTIAGIKTFSSAPVLSGASITTGTIPIASIVGTACDLTTNQTIAGTKTFSSPPNLSGAGLSASSVNAVAVIGTALTLSGAQTITGIKTFSAVPVLSGASITTGTIPLTSIVGTAVDLGTYQIISAIKQFTATPILTANLRLDGNFSLGGATVTITNATLQKIQYLSTVTSDIQTQINNISSNSISLANANTFTNSNTFQAVTFNGAISAQLGGTVNGTLNTNTLTCASLNNISQNTIAFLDATSSIQTQLGSKGGLAATNGWSGSNSFSGQLAGAYNAGSALVGQGSEFFFTGQRPWANGTGATGDNVYELSFDTGFYNRGLTIQGGCKNTLSGTGMKSCFGLYYRQYITGGTDPTRNPIMYGEDSETGAINNTLVIPSSLRLDGGLKVGSSGGTVITNTQLGYISTLSGNVQTTIDSNTTSITTLNTRTTDISWASGTTNTTTIANKLATSILTFGTSLNGISTAVFAYLSGVSSNLQTQLDTITTTMSGYNSAFTTINSKLPVGMILPYPINSLALPYLLCNGSAISRTTYSALFAKLGTLYGSGDGSTTFNLPNYQACFLRGYGNQTIGSTTYNTASVGSAQNDSIIGHQHSGQSGQYLSASSTTSATSNGYASLAIQKPSSSNFGTTGGVVNGGGSETAPAHHCIYYYILAQ